MDYDAAVSAFFAPRPEGTPLPAHVRAPTPARRLRDACEPVAMHGVWSPRTNAALAAEGLNFLTSYVGGRGSVLGGTPGPVVAAAFAWFEPGLVAGLWDAACRAVPLDRLRAVRDEATTASLRQVLDGDDPTDVADLLTAALADLETAGRPFTAGLLARGAPADPVHRLWWACQVVREHRGDTHAAVAVAAGLGPVEMNVLTELWVGMPLLSYTGTRGWPRERMETAVARLRGQGLLDGAGLSAQGAALRAELEERTDAAQDRIAAALGDRLEEVCTRLDAWGEACIHAGCFPADVLKRAAG